MCWWCVDDVSDVCIVFKDAHKGWEQTFCHRCVCFMLIVMFIVLLQLMLENEKTNPSLESPWQSNILHLYFHTFDEATRIGLWSTVGWSCFNLPPRCNEHYHERCCEYAWKLPPCPGTMSSSPPYVLSTTSSCHLKTWTWTISSRHGLSSYFASAKLKTPPTVCAYSFKPPGLLK